MENKTCIKCKVEKSIEEFYKSRTNKDGFYNKCKRCFVKDTKKK